MKFLLFLLLSFFLFPFQSHATQEAQIKFTFDDMGYMMGFRVWAENVTDSNTQVIIQNPNSFNFFAPNGENITNSTICLSTALPNVVDCGNSNYYDFIRVEPQNLTLFSDSENKYIYTSFTQDIPEEYQPQPVPQPQPTPHIEGCMDTLAINYDPQANVHIQDMCMYHTPPVTTPQDITGYIDTTQVQSGATTWNIILNLNVTGATLDLGNIQTWNNFTPINSTTNDRQIIITFQQFNGQRLNVECNNYELTIPRNAINTPEGDTNSNPITGNFSVVGCEYPITSTGQTDFPSAELNQLSQYLQIIGHKDGYYYLDIKSVTMLFFYLLISFSFFYVIFKFFNKKIH